MNNNKRQIVAEKIASTVRVLELLGLEYEVSGPHNIRKKGNKCPRVILARCGKKWAIRIYNSKGGATWANEEDGTPVGAVHSIEDLYEYLKKRKKDTAKKSVEGTHLRRSPNFKR